MANLRDESRQNWNGDSSLTSINSGSLQRIADAAERQAAATELMAAKYRQMEKDLEWYKREYNEKVDTLKRRDRANAALRGVIKRMKKARS